MSPGRVGVPERGPSSLGCVILILSREGAGLETNSACKVDEKQCVCVCVSVRPSVCLSACLSVCLPVITNVSM